MVGNPSQARQLGLQDQNFEQQLQRQQIANLGGDLNQIADYIDDKYMLDVLSQGGLDNGAAAQNFQQAFSGANEGNVGALAQANAANLQSQGFNPKDSLELAQLGQVAPNQAMMAVNNIQGMLQDPRIKNYLARNPERARGTLAAMTPKGDSEAIKARNKEDAKVREELRGDLRGRLGKLDASIDVIETNYNKIVGLTDEMKKGNRSAVAQGLVALVKLNDPNSAVLNSEMEAALNQQNPASALASYLFDKGVSDDVINSVSASFDPLNPNVINVDDLLSTADAMTVSNVNNINSNYSQYKDLGQNLGATGIKSIFNKGREKRLDNLSKIGQPSQLKPIGQDGYKVGQKSKGYEYTGGDPKDRANWRKL